MTYRVKTISSLIDGSKFQDFLRNIKRNSYSCVKYPATNVSWHHEFDIEKCVEKIECRPLVEGGKSIDKLLTFRKSWNGNASKTTEEVGIVRLKFQ